MIRYVEEVFPNFQIVRVPVPRRGIMGLLPGQSGMGYGVKITTDGMVVIGKRRYRVYCTQISNAGSYWIKIAGEQYFLR